MAESLHILLGTSACLQWLCHSGERTVARGPLVSFYFLHKSIYCGYSFELHRQVNAIQIGTHNISLFKEAAKKNIGKELLYCALVGVCAIIR